MPHIKFCKILDDDRLAEFHRKFCDRIKTELPISYFKSGNCYALIRKNEIIAGFCIVYRPANELFCLQRVPYFCHALYTDDFVYSTAEITGFFMDEKSYAFILTLLLVIMVLFCRAKYFVYSYPVDQKRLGQYYARGKPITIYSGRPKKREGYPDNLPAVYIGVLTKWGIVKIFLNRTMKYLRLF